MEKQSRLPSPAARWLLAAALLASAAGTAWARNDRMLLQIIPALSGQAVGPRLDPQIAVRFGSATAAGADANLPMVEVRGVAEPYGAINTNVGGHRGQRRSDQVVCVEAFRKAVFELQQRARSMGADAVVGVTSNYKDGPLDSREVYECRIGNSRGFVDLKARFARTAAAAPAAAPAAVPAAVMAPPAPGGRAAIDNVEAVPYLSERGRAEYRSFLAWPAPKAFAISTTGHFYATSGNVPKDGSTLTDPIERALAGCERSSGAQCKLYAVNGAVVWNR